MQNKSQVKLSKCKFKETFNDIVVNKHTAFQKNIALGLTLNHVTKYLYQYNNRKYWKNCN